MPSSDQRITIRLLNDGPMKWPMWLDNEIADDRARQPVSEELAAALLEWTDFYHAHYDDEWDSSRNVQRYNEMGRRVAVRVASELGGSYRVLLQLKRTPSEPQRWVEIR